MFINDPSRKVIRVGKLIDGRGGPPQEVMAVITEGSRILRVGRQADLLPTEGPTEVVDLQDGTMLPGLIDCHTHTTMPGVGLSVDEVHAERDDVHLLRAVTNAKRALESGVTTLRDNGGWNAVVFSLKEGIHRELVKGPRIVAAGRPLTITGGHCWMMGGEANGRDGVRANVRRLVHEGADFIKVMATGGGTRGTNWGLASYTAEELTAAVDEAHRHDRLVGIHALGTSGIVNALDAGADMVIHGTFFQPDGTVRLEPCVAGRIAESRTWVNPTLFVARQGVRLRMEKLEQRKAEPGFGPQERAALEAGRVLYDSLLSVVAKLIEAGVRIVAGSDCGWGSYPFGHFHLELRALMEAGLSSQQALAAGTRDAASALGLLDLIGTVEPGKRADLLVVRGNPITNIDDLASVMAVFKDGVRIR